MISIDNYNDKLKANNIYFSLMFSSIRDDKCWTQGDKRQFRIVLLKFFSSISLRTSFPINSSPFFILSYPSTTIFERAFYFGVFEAL